MIILIRYILNPIKVKIKPLTFYHNLIKISNKKWKKKKTGKNVKAHMHYHPQLITRDTMTQTRVRYRGN